MNRTLRRRLGLFAATGVLVALATWQWQHDRARRPAQLLDLEPTAVRRIDIRFAGGTAHHCERRRDRWSCTGDSTAPPDEGWLDDLAALAATPVTDWHPASAFDPRKLGLAPPAIVVRLDDHRLEYGDEAATGPFRFVRVDGARIALVPLAATPRPARQAARVAGP
ncbi:MAG: hypothetical protein QJR11_06870 [Fulvimonas sp.]|nr:hypothetical protein [Fulvimonas sp.]